MSGQAQRPLNEVSADLSPRSTATAQQTINVSSRQPCPDARSPAAGGCRAGRLRGSPAASDGSIEPSFSAGVIGRLHARCGPARLVGSVLRRSVLRRSVLRRCRTAVRQRAADHVPQPVQPGRIGLAESSLGTGAPPRPRAVEMPGPEGPGLSQPERPDQPDRLVDDAERGGDQLPLEHADHGGDDGQRGQQYRQPPHGPGLGDGLETVERATSARTDAVTTSAQATASMDLRPCWLQYTSSRCNHNANSSNASPTPMPNNSASTSSRESCAPVATISRPDRNIVMMPKTWWWMWTPPMVMSLIGPDAAVPLPDRLRMNRVIPLVTANAPRMPAKTHRAGPMMMNSPDRMPLQISQR